MNARVSDWRDKGSKGRFFLEIICRLQVTRYRGLGRALLLPLFERWSCAVERKRRKSNKIARNGELQQSKASM